MTAQIHFTAIFFAEPDGTGSWQAAGPEEAPVDANQFVFDDETDQWREPTDAEREIAIGASTDLVGLLHGDRAVAAQKVVDNLYWFLIDRGSSASCIEAEAMADLFRAYGKGALADAIIQSHAHGDDEPTDQHYGMALDGTFTNEGWQPGRPANGQGTLTLLD